MIAIIDYDAGNIKSVEKAFEYLNEPVVLTRDKETILQADGAVLPGVGAFGDAMNRLNEYGLTEVIHQYVQAGKPFLGICLGYQLMFDKSEEGVGTPGLGLFKGECIRFSDSYGLKVPQIGWNSLSFPKKSRIFDGLSDNTYVYFVHSYYVKADDESIVAATSEYGNVFHAACESGNVFGCQFHPEKSSDVGMKILKNFVKITNEAANVNKL